VCLCRVCGVECLYCKDRSIEALQDCTECNGGGYSVSPDQRLMEALVADALGLGPTWCDRDGCYPSDSKPEEFMWRAVLETDEDWISPVLGYATSPNDNEAVLEKISTKEFHPIMESPKNGTGWAVGLLDKDDIAGSVERTLYNSSRLVAICIIFLERHWSLK